MGSQYMALYYDIDAARIPAQILTGIGFIGAGTIIQNGTNVKGVTTAAGILSVTCIGLAVGMGYYMAAIIATMIVFIILSVNHEVSSKVERYENIDLTIIVEDNTIEALKEIRTFLRENNIELQSVKKDNDVIKNKKTEVLKISVVYNSRKLRRNDIISSLVSLKSIREVEEDR